MQPWSAGSGSFWVPTEQLAGSHRGQRRWNLGIGWGRVVLPGLQVGIFARLSLRNRLDARGVYFRCLIVAMHSTCVCFVLEFRTETSGTSDRANVLCVRCLGYKVISSEYITEKQRASSNGTSEELVIDATFRSDVQRVSAYRTTCTKSYLMG